MKELLLVNFEYVCLTFQLFIFFVGLHKTYKKKMANRWFQDSEKFMYSIGWTVPVIFGSFVNVAMYTYKGHLNISYDFNWWFIIMPPIATWLLILAMTYQDE